MGLFLIRENQGYIKGNHVGMRSPALYGLTNCKPPTVGTLGLHLDRLPQSNKAKTAVPKSVQPVSSTHVIITRSFLYPPGQVGETDSIASSDEQLHEESYTLDGRPAGLHHFRIVCSHLLHSVFRLS